MHLSFFPGTLRGRYLCHPHSTDEEIRIRWEGVAAPQVHSEDLKSQCQPALVAFSETPGKDVRWASVLCSQVRGKTFEEEGQVLWDHGNGAGTMTQAIRGDFLEEVMVTLPE